MGRHYPARSGPRSTRSGTLCDVLLPAPPARQITVGDAIRSLRAPHEPLSCPADTPPGVCGPRMSRFWAQRRQIVRCNMGIEMALPREMRPGAHVLNGGATAYNDDAELVAALHRGDRAARTVLVQRYEPLVERLLAGGGGGASHTVQRRH